MDYYSILQQQSLQDISGNLQEFKAGAAAVMDVSANLFLANIDSGLTDGAYYADKQREVGTVLRKTQEDILALSTQEQYVIWRNLVQQNDLLARELEQIQQANVTEDKRSYYQFEQNVNAQFFAGVIKGAWWALFVLFAAVFLFKVVLPIRAKVFWLVIVLLYPWWVGWLEYGVVWAWNYAGSMIYGRAFHG